MEDTGEIKMKENIRVVKEAIDWDNNVYHGELIFESKNIKGVEQK